MKGSLIEPVECMSRGRATWGRAIESNPHPSGVQKEQRFGVSYHHSLVSAQVRGGESLTYQEELFLGTEMSAFARTWPNAKALAHLCIKVLCIKQET